MRLEMLEMAGEVGVKWTGRLLNVCMQEGRIPKEWRMSLIVPIWKRKGDVHDPGKFRGITLLSQVLKLLERHTERRRGPVVGHSLWTRPARVQSPWEARIIRSKNLALYIRDCESLCLSDETVKAVGPFYLVSMPGEVKDPTQGVNV